MLWWQERTPCRFAEFWHGKNPGQPPAGGGTTGPALAVPAAARSGKILRKTMRGIADGTGEPVPSTIEDPAVLDALRPVLSGGD